MYKYKKNSLRYTQNIFIMTDILMYCYYCLRKRKNDNRITIFELQRNLCCYDNVYKSVEYERIKTIFCLLFPLHKNNRRRTKKHKINNLTLNYWSNKLGINYEFHSDIFLFFKFNERS